jgi:Adenylosuccinate synthase
LPKEAQNYVHALEELAGTPITMISVGPDRDQTIFRQN